MANTAVVFGDSGLFKTTNAGFAAKYEYEKTGGKIVRYISADGGGYRPIQPLVDAGIVEPLHLPDVKNPLVVARKLSTGYWPDRLEHGRWTGERLLPPTPDTWDRVGAIIVDTITSICGLFLEDLRDKQRSIGQDVVGKFGEEDEKFGASPPSHFGFVQREMLARIRSFAALPVDRVVFLAHEAKGGRGRFPDSDSRSSACRHRSHRPIAERGRRVQSLRGLCRRGRDSPHSVAHSATGLLMTSCSARP